MVRNVIRVITGKLAKKAANDALELLARYVTLLIAAPPIIKKTTYFISMLLCFSIVA
jgi:hypothetical protein